MKGIRHFLRDFTATAVREHLRSEIETSGAWPDLTKNEIELVRFIGEGSFDWGEFLSERCGRGMSGWIGWTTTSKSYKKRRAAVTPNRHGSSVIEFPTELEIVTTREFEAPVALVFDVLTKPEHVSKWFAPFECEVTECSIDLRVGGNRHIAFVTGDGTECSFRGTYLEVERADSDRRDVAVRRVARCGCRRVRGSAGNGRSDEADDEAGVPRQGRP
jgi:Activator of Hsp90 ATPase homolog 1-like protein